MRLARYQSAKDGLGVHQHAGDASVLLLGRNRLCVEPSRWRTSLHQLLDTASKLRALLRHKTLPQGQFDEI